MAFADLYEIRDFQVHSGSNILNVYHVERADPVYLSGNVLQAFFDSIIPTLLPLQPGAVEHVDVQCQSLSDPLDFSSAAPPARFGTRAGEGFPQFVATTIRFNRTRTDMHHGMKRILGGVETDGGGGGWLAPYLADVQVYADAVVAPWEVATAPGVDVAYFTILKRICSAFDAGGKCISYRLPESDAELVSYSPLTATVSSKTRSQVSRKLLN